MARHTSGTFCSCLAGAARQQAAGRRTDNWHLGQVDALPHAPPARPTHTHELLPHAGAPARRPTQHPDLDWVEKLGINGAGVTATGIGHGGSAEGRAGADHIMLECCVAGMHGALESVSTGHLAVCTDDTKFGAGKISTCRLLVVMYEHWSSTVHWQHSHSPQIAEVVHSGNPTCGALPPAPSSSGKVQNRHRTP